MEFIQSIMHLLLKGADLFLHLDVYLGSVIQSYGNWTYLILFLIIFCETGLVVFPILPGDSLLFAIGTFCALGSLDLAKTLTVLSVAAILGDTVNYAIGHYMGPKVFQYKDSRIFRKEYLQKTHEFYEKYGGKTIILARFLPIVRTFAPFVAGIVRMDYPKFLMYNVIGGCVWILLFYCAGFYFGNIPLVKEHFSEVILAIIVLSVIPAVIEFLKMRKPRK